MTDPTTTTPPTAEASLGFPDTEPGQIVAGVELERVTMAELGQVLPDSRKAYQFHRPTVGTLRRLGQLQGDRSLQARPGHHVALYLSAALKELDGEDFGGVERDENRARKVAELPAGDVLTLLVAWTDHQHRKGVQLGGAGCGACGATWASLRVKLSELEVLALPAEAARPPVARVGLWDGFPVAGKDAQAVLVSPPTWGESMGALSREGWSNPMAIRAANVQGSIKGTDVLPKVGRLGAEAVDEIMAEDLDLIDHALGQITASVSLELQVTCPSCKATNTTSLDWKTLGFSGGLSSP